MESPPKTDLNCLKEFPPLALDRDMKQHPLAIHWPDWLAQNEEASTPVILYQGKILDGWARYKVHKRLNSGPVSAKTYIGTDPVGYVVTIQAARWWNEMSRMEIATRTLLTCPVRGRGRPAHTPEAKNKYMCNRQRTLTEIADLSGLSRMTIKRAKRKIAEFFAVNGSGNGLFNLNGSGNGLFNFALTRLWNLEKEKLEWERKEQWYKRKLKEKDREIRTLQGNGRESSSHKGQPKKKNIDQALAKELNRYGLTTSQCNQTLSTYPPDYIRTQLKYVTAALETGTGVRNVAAFTLAAIANDFASGAIILKRDIQQAQRRKQQEQKQQAEAERTKKKAEEDRQKQASAKKYALLAKQWKALPADIQQSIEQEAAERIQKQESRTFWREYQIEQNNGRTLDTYSPIVRYPLREACYELMIQWNDNNPEQVEHDMQHQG